MEADNNITLGKYACNDIIINKIRSELVDESYYNDIKYNLSSKSRWKFIGDISEALAYLCSGLSTMLAFSSGFFSIRLLPFIAGCFGTGSLLLFIFSSYAMKESKERTKQVNYLLSDLGIHKIPDIVIDSATDNTQIRRQSLSIIEV